MKKMIRISGYILFTSRGIATGLARSGGSFFFMGFSLLSSSEYFPTKI